jgi:hypothetical protein
VTYVIATFLNLSAELAAPLHKRVAPALAAGGHLSPALDPWGLGSYDGVR